MAASGAGGPNLNETASLRRPSTGIFTADRSNPYPLDDRPLRCGHRSRQIPPPVSFLDDATCPPPPTRSAYKIPSFVALASMSTGHLEREARRAIPHRAGIRPPDPPRPGTDEQRSHRPSTPSCPIDRQGLHRAMISESELRVDPTSRHPVHRWSDLRRRPGRRSAPIQRASTRRGRMRTNARHPKARRRFPTRRRRVGG